MSAANILNVENVSLKLGGRQIIKRLSFKANYGDIIGFIGPNGAGKTTMMRIINGVLEPNEGIVSFNNIDVLNNRIEAQKQFGYLPEGGPLYLDMTPKTYLEFLGNARGIKGEELKNKIIKAVELTQLEQNFHQRIETMSKGFKRRVALAGAILHEPKLLTLDEPTDGLDPNQKIRARSTIKSLGKDKIIIISTHILDEVAAICNRVILINKGEKIIDESKDDFMLRAGTKSLDELFFELTHKPQEAL